MDFSWTQDQLALRDSVIAFAGRELAGDVQRDDHEGVFRRERWNACAAFGLLGLAVPQEYGGSGLDALSTILALEALGYASRDNGLIFGLNAQMWAVQTPLLRFGTDEQRRRYLPRLVDGTLIGAHGMTEAHAGSDPFALATTAVRRGDHYVLNGTKMFISNAPVADFFLVFATKNRKHGFMGISAFLVERGTPGLSVGKPIAKMGLRTSPMAEVVLEECAIPAEQRLGAEGNGGTIFRHSMGWERCCILASCVGSMTRIVETCVTHATARKQFGKPISSFQAVSHRIVDMKVRLEAARLLLYRAGWRRDCGEDVPAEAATAKLAVAEAYVQTCLDAVQIHGGYGYTTEFELERELRDAIGSRIYSGTSEMQREIIADALGL